MVSIKVLFPAFTVFLSVIIPSGCLSQSSPSLQGRWGGVVDFQDEKSRLVLTIKQDNVDYKGWITSIDKSSDSLELQYLKLDSTHISFFIREQGLHYKGKFIDDVSFTGHLIINEGEAGQQLIPINFKRISENDTAFAVKRPQTPKQPYPYQSTNVSIENKAAGITICATVTKPHGKGPFPGAVIISGSGRDDRDGTEDFHKRWLIMGDFLTRLGFAVIRFDEREMGCTTGDFDTATTWDFASDVQCVLDYLSSQPYVNRKSIGLFGHSEGAIIAPMLAVAPKNEIAYLVLMGTPALNLSKIANEHFKKLILLYSKDSAQAKAYGEFLVLRDSIVGSNLSTEKVKVALQIFEKDTILNPMGFPINTSTLEGGTLSNWYRQLLNYDPLPNLQNIRCPMLVLQGEYDINVGMENFKSILPIIEHYNAIQKSKGNTFISKGVVIKKANHFMQTDLSYSGDPNSIINITETFSTEVFAEVKKFLRPLLVKRKSQ